MGQASWSGKSGPSWGSSRNIYSGGAHSVIGRSSRGRGGGESLTLEQRGLAPSRPGANSSFNYAQAEAAVKEAKRKAEASKASALGYYAPIKAGLEGMTPELITGEQKGRMMGERRASLGAYGQNLAGMHGDATSGVQSGIRREIGMGIAGRQSNLPMELELEVGAKNREAQLGLYGAQAGVAGGMSQIQQSFEYDPGLAYVKSLGFSAGRGGSGGSGNRRTLGPR